MSNPKEESASPLYLQSAFQVALSKNPGVIQFPQLKGTLKRARIPRLKLIDTLSRGYPGPMDELVEQIAQAGTKPHQMLREFAAALLDKGHVARLEKRHLLFPPAKDPVPAPLPQARLQVPAPATLLVQDGAYLWFNHDGELLLSLSLAEITAASYFTRPTDVDTAWAAYCEARGIELLQRSQYDAFLQRLMGAGLLLAPDGKTEFDDTPLYDTVQKSELQEQIDARVAAHDAAVAQSGRNLVEVVPVNTQKGRAPQSLGMLVAYAIDYEGGKLTGKYDFVPMFMTDESRLLKRKDRVGVYLFSNYIWNVEENLRLSAAIKAANPNSVTIHGGPSTPKFPADADKFFADNPQVDIAVLGEGELTLADTLDKLDLPNQIGLEALFNVPGLAFRYNGKVVRTEERERIADLDTIPSPFLTGLFEEFGSVKAAAIIESNRGCPYGCTFCDWGSATLSKVRRFDLDRVFAELEWAARHQIEDASIADANFGMLERDVQIAEKIAELKGRYGYPRTVSINYAKNQVRYLKKIIEIFSAAEILSEGVVSLQSMDEVTLKSIDRSNIKLEKYDELVTEFRQSNLPLAADIMMGLPGSTPASFRKDLQGCTDREVRARANYTQLLPNSPMNSPDYRQEYGISAVPGEILQETSTYTRQEWEEMNDLRLLYYLLDSFGILRYVATFVRSQSGLLEVDFYDRIRTDILHNDAEWPIVSTCLRSLEGHMGPPGSWKLFIEEIRRYLTERLGLANDSALRTVLAVQHAHLPSPDRRFPLSIELEHDFAAWQAAIQAAREQGHRPDWQDHVPRLAEFGPAQLRVEDPSFICLRDVGEPKYVLDYNLRTWELSSPIARPRLLTAGSAAS